MHHVIMFVRSGALHQNEALDTELALLILVIWCRLEPIALKIVLTPQSLLYVAIDCADTPITPICCNRLC